MSIPPLVCSTPPPLEQCDDEKEIEEFSINYNLPLDDMDDSLYTYDHIRPDLACKKDLPTAIPDYHIHHGDYETRVPEYLNNVEHIPNGDLYSGDTVNSECEKECGSLQLNKGTSRIDEDNNIEDLDLKVDVIPVDTDKGIQQLDNNFQEFGDIENLKSEYIYEAQPINKTAEDTPEHIKPEFTNILPIASKNADNSDVDESTELEKSSNNISNKSFEGDEVKHFQSCDELNSKDIEQIVLRKNTELNHLEEGRHSCELSEDHSKYKVEGDSKHKVEDDSKHEVEDDSKHKVEDDSKHKVEDDSKHKVEDDSKHKGEINVNENNEFEFKDESNDNDEFNAFQDFDAFKTFTSLNDDVEDTWASAGIEDNLESTSNITPHSIDSDGDDFDTFQSVTSKDIFSNISSKEEPNLKTTKLSDNFHTNQFATEIDQEDNDDFGDFDAYQSTTSAIKQSEPELTKNEDESIVESATLNLQSGSKEHIFESIQESFNTLYPVEDGQKDDEQCGTLESRLSECWGHLTDSETRQPYCRSWNTSAGQKTLLKALGIDSRNILFGPKWNLGMPRYAANLSASPLQPLQPAKPPAGTPADSQLSVTKSASDKPAAEWNLSQESQESRDKVIDDTNHRKHIDDINHLPQQYHTESDWQNSTSYLPAGPSYPSGSTPRQQPPTNLNFHQINLPDTHIFTPTDSETPRSQTIHNHTPTREEILTVQITNEGTNIQQSENLDDDFDDFQGSVPQDNVQKYVLEESVHVMEKDESQTDKSEDKIEIVNRSSAGVYQGHSVLEPVKIEPIMPTLNWPDPGEIKETFDDFSEFVSHSDWGNGNASFNNVSSAPLASSSQHNLQTANDVSTEKTIKFETLPETISASQPPDGKTTVFNEFKGFTNPILPLTTTKLITNNGFSNDDFDTFQSAKPEFPSITPELLHPTPALSFSSVSINNLNVKPSPTLVPLKFQTGHTVMSPSKNNYFQMSQPNSLDQQAAQLAEKNTQQILQPLSLESFSNSQINWPDPGIDIHQLSRFNPILSVHSLKNSSQHTNGSKELPADDDGWGDFVSKKPATNSSPKHAAKQNIVDDSDDWSDFVSNTGPKYVPNGVNTISFNVATNLSMSAQQLGNGSMKARTQIRNVTEVPSLNYVTPKTNGRNHNSHFQNL